MADQGRTSMGKQLADERNRRLEDALKSYSSDKTKQAVGKLLEEYIDENGTNYFTPGSHNATLYFADDDYIKEIEKVKLSDDEELNEPEEEKNGFLNWFFNRNKKKSEDEYDEDTDFDEDTETDGSEEGFEMPDPDELEKHDDRLRNGVRPNAEQDETVTEEVQEDDEPIETDGADEQLAEEIESVEEIRAEEYASEGEAVQEAVPENEIDGQQNLEAEAVDEQPEVHIETADEQTELEQTDEQQEIAEQEEVSDEQENTDKENVGEQIGDETESESAVPMETIVADKPVLTEETIKAEQEKMKSAENEENEKVKTVDDELDYIDDDEETPRRRRARKGKIKPPDIEEDYDEDDDEEEEAPKKSFFAKFKKHKDEEDDYDDDDLEEDDEPDDESDDEIEDEDEYYDDEDDDDFDDDDFDDDDFDDDDYDDEPAISAKKILLIIFVILLIGAVTALSAVCYSYKTKFDSATNQIKELQSQGVTANENGDANTEVSSLQAQVASLTAENARLKNGGAEASTQATSTAAQGATQAVQVVDSDSVVQSTTAATASGKTYTIKAGDNGMKICAEVYGEYTEENWSKILKANGMTDSTVYHPGQVLNIPQ